MADSIPGELVHFRHAHLGGALCRAIVHPAPLVTTDVRYVTCSVCAARKQKPVYRAASTERVQHALSPYWGRFGRAACGYRPENGTLIVGASNEVTCRRCWAALGGRGQREVERG